MTEQMKTIEDEMIGYRRWGVSPSKAVFLLVHGLGAHAGRWEAAGEFFAKNGITSYAIELKKFDPPTEIIPRLYDIAAKENPGKKIFLVGESFGAILSLFVVSRAQGLFAGLVCISPAFVSRVRPSFIDQLNIAASLLYNPQKQFRLPFDSAMCTHDVEYIKKMDKDSREYRTVSSKFILTFLLAQVQVRSLRDTILLPVLFLIAGDDKLVDSAASVKEFKNIAAKDKTLIEFPGMYHSLSIELGKEKVFEEMLKWVEERIK